MMRKEYIAGLEEIRKRMIEIGQAFAAVDLTDATGMERDRRKKTAKLVGDLADRLYEDIAISAKVAADKANRTTSSRRRKPRSWTCRRSRTSRLRFRPRSRRRRSAARKATSEGAAKK